VLITAGLFLLALQRLLLGSFDGTEDELRPRMTDMAPHELAAIVPLVVLFTAIGLYPRLVLDVIEPTAQVIAGLVAGS
jgi:NADH-quinone oxidoreductase subunit M